MVDDRLNANPRVDEAHHCVSPAGFTYLVTRPVAEVPVDEADGRGSAHSGSD
jgi:hypothetical protein